MRGFAVGRSLGSEASGWFNWSDETELELPGKLLGGGGIDRSSDVVAGRKAGSTGLRLEFLSDSLEGDRLSIVINLFCFLFPINNFQRFILLNPRWYF